jgi:hypothetical protein
MLTRRFPVRTNRKDMLLMCCLRRCNLDAFWGREESTVVANRRNLDRIIQLAGIYTGREPLLPQLGPYPVKDVFGVEIAVAMLLQSMQPGRYQEFSQFETMMKLRSAYSNLYHASAAGAAAMSTLGRDTAKSFMTDCPAQSLWFERFTRGCLKRMGQTVKQDLALSLAVTLELQKILEEEWERGSVAQREALALIGAYCCIAYGGSFHGHEVFYVDLLGLTKYAESELQDSGVVYAIIPLLGRFKNETGERYHLTPLVATTSSGLQISLWTRQLVEVKKRHAIAHGPAFSDARGNLINSRWLAQEVLDRLHLVQTRRPDLISMEVNVHEEYGISRSFRRGATTEARNRGVQQGDIDTMNRWRNVENAKGKRPRVKMQDHYSDIRMMIPTLLRFSAAL